MMVPLNVQISESALKTLRAQLGDASGDANGGRKTTTGTHCGNNACKKVFTGPESDAEECVYHPGSAVFHEGLKFWSCCERKTTDFSTFLDQAGCTRGKHCWKKKEIVANVREDWFQRGGQVHITIYCKGAIPEETVVKSDGLTLEVNIGGFAKRYELFGEVAPAESVVTVNERNVEIVLKQMSKTVWPRLLKQQTTKRTQNDANEPAQKQQSPPAHANEAEKQDEVLIWNGLNKPSERYTTSRPMLPLDVQLSESALKTLRAQLDDALEFADEGQKATTGAHCANNACKKVFTGPESDAEECVYHPGSAVFHEGLKFWSCCERKTTDFSTFLDQAGCTRGKHCWKKKEIVANVREDWFQRGGQVHITIYCKGAIPEETVVKSDGLTLEVNIGGFAKRYELFGEVAPAESVVIISERKVEIMLKQVAKIGWPKLCYEPSNNS